jgi:hypothetical protein
MNHECGRSGRGLTGELVMAMNAQTKPMTASRSFLIRRRVRLRLRPEARVMGEKASAPARTVVATLTLGHRQSV